MKIGNRIEILQEFDAITARIKTPKHIFLLLFLPVWLIGWALGGLSALKLAIKGQGLPIFLLIWLGAWLVGVILVATVWLWNAFGYEIVSIRSGFFSFRREIFRLAFTRKEIFIYDLSNLRTAGVFGAASSRGRGLAQWNLTGGTVAIGHDNKTLKFGIGLEEQEAKALVAQLAPYIPRKI
jgi:hypothetical protein